MQQGSSSVERTSSMNTTIILSSIHTFRHRETQRTLAANARYDINADGITGTTQRGLGRLEDGIGYFPSLAALQFQSAVPGPSPSVAAYENQDRERLDRILKCLGLIVLLYFLFS